MSGQRRMIRHKKVYHITNRTKQGLPFVPNKYIELLIGGLISRTDELYSGVEINAILFMGNHYHLITTIVGDPTDLSRFMCYFQGELSSIIHRLTGVCNDSLWVGKYKLTELLTAETVMEKISYLFLNPVRAKLVKTIKDWEGFSSYQEFISGENKREFRWVSDSLVERLPRGNFSDQQIERLCESVEEVGRGFRNFIVNTFSWKKSFSSSKNISDEELKKQLLDLIEDEEKNLNLERKNQGKSVMGASLLRYQSIYKSYKSKSFGKTPTSLSTCDKATVLFEDTYKTFKNNCRIIYERWKLKLSKLELPPGAFYPPIVPQASLIS